MADLLLGGWTISAAMSFQSGFPINIQQAADRALGGQNANRPNLTGADLSHRTAIYYDRLASADHPTATWLNPAAFSLAPAGTFGNTPRTHHRCADAVTAQHRHLAHQELQARRLEDRAQFKMEVINLLNRPNVRNLQGANVFGNANFAQNGDAGRVTCVCCSSRSDSRSSREGMTVRHP